MAELVEENKKRSLLPVCMTIIGWLAMIIFALHSTTRMVGAGDTWVAMACGRHFINHGVDTVEPFSANSHKSGPTEEEIQRWPESAQWLADKVGLNVVKYWHPTGWINQNWLTHVIFYWLTHKSPFADAQTLSFNSLVYWKFATYILTVICVYYTCRLLGAHQALSAFFSCAAMFVGRSFFDIRPAGFSNLLVAVFLLVLVLTTYRNILYIWLIVPVTVFWCNLHGGYIYAFIILVPFIGLHFILILLKKHFVSIGFKGLIHTIAAAFVTFMATIIFNPFHLTNLTHTFVISVSRHAEKWRTVNEWHPAFEWSNLVGTAFAFFVLFIFSIGLTIFWLFSRLIKPKFLKAPKNIMDAQEKSFKILSAVFTCAAVIFGCWVTFIGFSFLNIHFADFFICTVFVGIILFSIYKNVHFIYFIVLLSLLALWSGNPKVGFTGRYIYPFVLLPVYVTLHIIASLLFKKIKFKVINIIFVVLTAVLSLVLITVIFNPFNFKLPVWHVGQFLNIKRLWHPLYESDGGSPLKYTWLFDAIFYVNILSLLIWLLFPYLRNLFTRLNSSAAEQSEPDTYQLPKIDLTLIVIAALTVYMAIRSRRFIPIAAIAACPIFAALIDQMAHTFSAARNFHQNNTLTVSPMSYGTKVFITIAGAAAVISFGTWWSLKFKRIYLDPWPTDPKLNSVFMRMTASDAKPFYACRFIRENNLQGKMFNYWTEGGFIAFGQKPDPNTGKTPLQLFMDGRAQAAYDRKAYEVWSEIMFGGPYVQSARLRGHKLTSDDYKKIGNWISERLKKRKVWVILMPANQFGTAFVKGIERTKEWQLVFLNNKQRLYVDTTSPQGKELFNKVIHGKAVYPDAFSENLIMAHSILLFGKGIDAKKQGFDFAVKAFELNPSQTPIQKILLFARFNELKPRVETFCKDYFNRFFANKADWAKLDGYHHRIVAAMLACDNLRKTAQRQKNKELTEFYLKRQRQLRSERSKVLKNRW